MPLNAKRPSFVTASMMPGNLLASLVFSALVPSIAAGQSFNTVSVKPSQPEEPREPVRVTSDRVSGVNVTLQQLLGSAYGLPNWQISGPPWMQSNGYDVSATTNQSAGAAQMRVMLQGLLADRFKLKTHRETKEIPAYWLEVAPGGAKLRDPSEEQAFQASQAGKSPFKPGFAGMYTNKDLPGFAERLSRGVGRPVIDKTGIKGRYWFQLEWPVDKDHAGINEPALISAMREQVGLTLEEKTAPYEVLVIDEAVAP